MDDPQNTALAQSTVSGPTTAAAIPRAARRVRHDWTRLSAPTEAPALFDPSMVEGLPEPARRYLTHAIAAGTPLRQSVQVSMLGQIKLRRWRPFTAVQVITAGRGYIWAARTRLPGMPVVGYDRLSAGTAEMRWRILDLVPVVTARGPDTARSAAGRLAFEIVMVPTGFPTALWSAAGPTPRSPSGAPAWSSSASSCTSTRPASRGT